MNRPILLGSLLVVGAATLFGTLGYVTRMADQAGLGALAFIAWRGVVATLAMLAFSALLGGRRHSRLPRLGGLERRQLLLLAVACACSAVLNIAIFLAFLRTTIAVALICFYTFPAIVALAAVPLYGDRLDRIKVLALLLSSAGLLLVVLAPALTSRGLIVDEIGVGLALLGAVCQATFVLIAGRGFGGLPALHVGAYAIGAGALLSLVLIGFTGEVVALALPLADAGVWPWIVAGGITGAAIPTTAFLAGIAVIGPSRAAILMTVEPVVSVALAGMLLGETPVPLQLVGGAAVLAAAIILQASPGGVPEEAEPRII